MNSVELFQMSTHALTSPQLWWAHTIKHQCCKCYLWPQKQRQKCFPKQSCFGSHALSVVKHVADRSDGRLPLIYMPINNQPIPGDPQGVKRANQKREGTKLSQTLVVIGRLWYHMQSRTLPAADWLISCRRNRAVRKGAGVEVWIGKFAERSCSPSSPVPCLQIPWTQAREGGVRTDGRGAAENKPLQQGTVVALVSFAGCFSTCQNIQAQLTRHILSKLGKMDVLPMCSIFQELQIVHDTGYFSALPSLEEYWQQVNISSTLRRVLSCNSAGFVRSNSAWEVSTRPPDVLFYSRCGCEVVAGWSGSVCQVDSWSRGAAARLRRARRGEELTSSRSSVLSLSCCSLSCFLLLFNHQLCSVQEQVMMSMKCVRVIQLWSGDVCLWKDSVCFRTSFFLIWIISSIWFI